MMQLILRADLLAVRAYNAARLGDRALALACTPGPPQAREPILLGIGPWEPHTPPPPVCLAISHAPYPIRRPHSWRYLAQHVGPLAAGTGVLWLGQGHERGQFVGVVHAGGTLQPITDLRLIGPGLERVRAVDFWAGYTPSTGEMERWSRHIGALDLSTWLRQREMRVAVVGAGRLGSVVATTLARWGSPLSLIDSDRLEMHNLDAADELTPMDLGLPKVVALAKRLLRLGTGAPVDAVVADVDTFDGRAALANAEVVVCCVDNAIARGFVGRWARRYGLVLLDVGSAVRREGARWHAGSDVRLLLPGDGCLKCWGGVGEERDRPPVADWREDRAGSLRTLNQVAGNLGLILLEQLLHGRLGQSTWLRVEIEASGVPAVQQIRPGDRADCPGCLEAFRGASADDVLGVD